MRQLGIDDELQPSCREYDQANIDLVTHVEAIAQDNVRYNEEERLAREKQDQLARFYSTIML